MFLDDNDDPSFQLIIKNKVDKANKAIGITLDKLLPLLSKSGSLYPGHELSAPH